MAFDISSDEFSLNDLLEGPDSSNNDSGILDMDYMIKAADNVRVNESSLTYYFTSANIAGNVALIVAYAILFLVSLFGNTMVCYVIFRNRRMHTVTNLFIVNLALADITVTLLNLPFNVPRHLLDNWPFGDVICHIYSFSLMISVYVSTFTMTAIALDRHQVILYPLRPRISMPVGVVIVVIIWIASSAFSIPFGIYQKVKLVNFISKEVYRCTTEYPEPAGLFEQCLTTATLLLQYVTPLVIIAAAYGRVVQRLWVRTSLGALTHDQQIFQAKAKRKSIQMLITVVILFGICWMPLNLYHIITDLHPDKEIYKHDSTVFFICHWIAISNTCYNPFIYCWLNDAFRREVTKIFSCFLKRSSLTLREADSVATRASRSHRADRNAKLRNARSATLELDETENYFLDGANNGTSPTVENFPLTAVIESRSMDSRHTNHVRDRHCVNHIADSHYS